ncbi:hypothetical protein ANCDUO_06174 [Ancylostoma duodenale]|uniref:Uncharacterized protein n=1 Tax=Ancylostoma duodenale TaxID=51022 RepID=A0A0C2D2E4_9BILA|nr:hypothetical protein ANCDUO_06174 [Ancylostoma duodenale]
MTRHTTGQNGVKGSVERTPPPNGTNAEEKEEDCVGRKKLRGQDIHGYYMTNSDLETTVIIQSKGTGYCSSWKTQVYNRMRTLVVLIVLLAFQVAARTANLKCLKTDSITKKEMDDAVFVAEVEVKSTGAEGGNMGGTIKDYFVYTLEYVKIFYTYYDWFSEYKMKRDAPKELKINKKCPNASLEEGERYVLGSKMYEEADFNFVKPLINVTNGEWKLINGTKN